MYIVDRSLRFVRGALLSYGPTGLKKLVWNKEFAGTKWNFIDHTVGDCVYPPLEKYAKNGSILDLGCGPGNTANELADSAYTTYVGMDISEEALAKARRRTEEAGRTGKNRFDQGDFLSYVPSQKFDVILFRESLYHVPLGKVKAILDRFSAYLDPTGVFIVRLYLSDNGVSKRRPNAMFKVIEDGFEVLEKSQYAETGAAVVVFRPKRSPSAN